MTYTKYGPWPPSAQVNDQTLFTAFDQAIFEAHEHIDDTSGAHAASAISYGGGTGMSATDVEAAIDELATEKSNTGHTHTGYHVFYWTFDGTAAVTTGNKQVPVPFTGTLVKAWARATTAPTGAALIFDMNYDGSTIWSTQANRLQIAASGNSGTQTTFNTTAVTEDHYVTCDIDQIGSTVAGANIVVALKMSYTVS